jgi:hypothetical protein
MWDRDTEHSFSKSKSNTDLFIVSRYGQILLLSTLGSWTGAENIQTDLNRNLP